MTPCGQIKPARHALLQLLQAGGGPGLIRRVAATARIDPRPVTRGAEEPEHLFLFERAQRENRTTRQEGLPARGQPTWYVLEAQHRERSNHVSNPSGQFTC